MNIMGITAIRRCGLTAIALIFSMAPLAQAQGTSTVHAAIVVKVSDRDHAADAIATAAQQLDGYFAEKSLQQVDVRIPAGKVEDLIDQASRLGEIVDRRYNREDLGDMLLSKQAALKARLATQKQYEALLKQANVDAVLYVEKELIQLIAEIETLKGTIRHLEHRIQYAQVQVAFEYIDRPAPATDGNSSFEWLNSMNLTDLLGAY